MSASSPGPASPTSATTSSSATSSPERIDLLPGGRRSVLRAGTRGARRAQPRRLRFTLSMEEAVDGAEFLFICVGTPPTASGDAEPLRGLDGDRGAAGRHREAGPGDEEHGAGGDGREGPRRARRARTRRGSAMSRAPSSSPRARPSATSWTPTASSSARSTTRTATLSSGCTRVSTRRSSAWTSPRPRWSSSPRTRTSAPASASSTRSRTSASSSAPTSRTSRAAWASTAGSARTTCAPGIGFGGSCFPKDISFLKLLAGNSGYHFHARHRRHRGQRAPDAARRWPKLQKHLGSLRGKRIALLGLAFKPNTDDMREAPSLVLAARLLAEGAEVVAWDPVADARDVAQRRRVRRQPRPTPSRGADAAVVVTEWPELRDLPWARAARRRCARRS